MPGKWRYFFVAMAACAVVAVAIGVQACPFCPPTESTLSEKLASSDAACIVQFVEAKNGEELSMQTTKFLVKQLMKPTELYKVDDEITVEFGVTGEAGDTFLLMGQKVEDSMDWSLPVEIDEVSREYVRQAPSPESASKAERLAYFLQFLDVANPIIANDAFGEFSRADFADLKQLVDKTPHDKLRAKVRKWLDDPNPQLVVRRGFYGMLLGLCGNRDDAEYLKAQSLAPIDPTKNRIGIDGIMGGYLLLAGEEGLQTLVKQKLDAPSADTGDQFELQRTLRFLWDFRRSQFSDESLRSAMRHYLNLPQMAELAVIDLARWKDWKSLDQLIAAYGRVPWETPSAQEKVIAFAISCRKDAKPEADGRLPGQAAKAQKFLDSLDPALVQSARGIMGGLYHVAPASATKEKDSK